jgi:hypothetical protein
MYTGFRRFRVQRFRGSRFEGSGLIPAAGRNVTSLIEKKLYPCFTIDKAQRHQYWTFDVESSMFDVQSFNLSTMSCEL